MSDACTIWLGPEFLHTKEHPVGAETPVKLEVITEEGETFVIAMTRPAWAQLILGQREVEGWIEPLEVDDENAG